MNPNQTVTGTGGGCQAPAACDCPACGGLRTFTRPRFFAGQLLKDADLTALTDYVVDKQRLHNRYLHGPGVVCGLQVECDGCGPGVVVRPGYALDPCGNDVVLPEAVSLDIAALARACTPDRRAADCDPPRYPTATGCDDRDQVWCLWVRYREQPTRAVMPLGATTSSACVQPAPTAGRATSGSSRSATCGCATPPRQTGAPADCQPSRVCEYLEFGVAPKDDSCDSLESALAGTFPAKVLECIQRLRPVLTGDMNTRMQRSALSLVTGGQVGLNSTARDAVCQLYANVVELYQGDPMHARCVLPAELQTIDCSPRGEQETDAQFQARLARAVQQLLMLVLLYLRDCLCSSLLPPCPGEVCDDRVVLGCVTMRGGQVVDICNFACRRYAGSFVNREYWLPIGPVLSLLAAKLCCFPLALPADQVSINDDRHAETPTDRRTGALRTPMLQTRYAHLMSAVRSDDFALLKLWRTRAVQLSDKARLAYLLGLADGALSGSGDHVRLAPLLHTEVDDAAQKLRAKGVEVSVVEVSERDQAVAFDLVPRVQRGGVATLYTRGGIVIGVRGSESMRTERGGRR